MKAELTFDNISGGGVTISERSYSNTLSCAKNTPVSTGQSADDCIVYALYSSAVTYDAMAIIQNGEVASICKNYVDITISNGTIMVSQSASSNTVNILVKIFK